MDDIHFDDLARRLGRGATRRRVIAAALGVTAIVVESSPVSAKRTCRAVGHSCTRPSQCCSSVCVRNRKLPRWQLNRCGCESSLTRCGNTCVDTAIDSGNCGDCNRACSVANNETCEAGECCGLFYALCETDADCCSSTFQCRTYRDEPSCAKRNGQVCADDDECWSKYCSTSGICADDEPPLAG